LGESMICENGEVHQQLTNMGLHNLTDHIDESNRCDVAQTIIQSCNLEELEWMQDYVQKTLAVKRIHLEAFNKATEEIECAVDTFEKAVFLVAHFELGFELDEEEEGTDFIGHLNEYFIQEVGVDKRMLEFIQEVAAMASDPKRQKME
jgi:hypothetical protein